MGNGKNGYSLFVQDFVRKNKGITMLQGYDLAKPEWLGLSLEQKQYWKDRAKSLMNRPRVWPREGEIRKEEKIVAKHEEAESADPGYRLVTIELTEHDDTTMVVGQNETAWGQRNQRDVEDIKELFDLRVRSGVTREVLGFQVIGSEEGNPRKVVTFIAASAYTGLKLNQIHPAEIFLQSVNISSGTKGQNRAHFFIKPPKELEKDPQILEMAERLEHGIPVVTQKWSPSMKEQCFKGSWKELQAIIRGFLRAEEGEDRLPHFAALPSSRLQFTETVACLKVIWEKANQEIGASESVESIEEEGVKLYPVQNVVLGIWKVLQSDCADGTRRETLLRSLMRDRKESWWTRNVRNESWKLKAAPPTDSVMIAGKFHRVYLRASERWIMGKEKSYVCGFHQALPLALCAQTVVSTMVWQFLLFMGRLLEIELTEDHLPKHRQVSGGFELNPDEDEDEEEKEEAVEGSAQSKAAETVVEIAKPKAPEARSTPRRISLRPPPRLQTAVRTGHQSPKHGWPAKTGHRGKVTDKEPQQASGVSRLSNNDMCSDSIGGS